MLFPSNNWGLYTDFYELTMAQGYFYCGKKDETSVFNYFFRTNPYKGGFTVFAGLDDFINILTNFSYSQDDIIFLKKLGFKQEFLKYLSSFHFSGNIYSVHEGEIMFPNEPVLQIEGNIIECQLIESLLLNILNFESLIATKSFRIKLVTGDKIFSDFGLRRAQGFGAIHGSRATIIGGALSTSNVLAGKTYNIPVSGTQAHSWVQSFANEADAFRAFAKVHPNDAVFLVDTYNTIKSGIPNAIMVAKEIEKEGHKLKAIRLDSGDLAYLSKQARKMLDEANLKYVKIFVSNQLNEYVLKSIIQEQHAPIDAFGIGTELITGKHDGALDGVYKLTELNNIPKMKFSENIEKITIPCKKQVYRYFDKNGLFYRDALVLANEDIDKVEIIYHPIHPERKTLIKNLKREPLLNTVVYGGKVIIKKENPFNIHKYLLKRAKLLPEGHKRFISPHIYKVGISKKLKDIKDTLTHKFE